MTDPIIPAMLMPNHFGAPTWPKPQKAERK